VDPTSLAAPRPALKRRSVKAAAFSLTLALLVWLPVPASEATYPGTPGLIAFVRGFSDLWVSNPDGSNPRLLVAAQPGASVGTPSWSPDGSTIVFGDGGSIYTVDADGRNVQRIGTGSGPSFTPDGRVLAAVETEEGSADGLVVMDADGGNVRRLTSTFAPGARWSPDGRQIAFTCPEPTPAVCTMNPDGSGLRRLVEGGRQPDWSPDSRHLAFMVRDEDGAGNVAVVRRDGSQMRRVTNDPLGNVSVGSTSVTWTPDGRLLFSYQVDEGDGNDQVFIMDADGTDRRRLIRSPNWDTSPAQQPLPRRGGCTLVGTPGRDRLVGTAHRDVICGLGGRDVIDGRGGNDLLRGGPGPDLIRGGPGADVLAGGDGADRLVSRDGVSGNDLLVGGRHRDAFFADRGDTVRR
jgi:Tol biopolymer transport system component